MSESFLNDRIELHCGDCFDVLATLPDNSLDACVTDPPYHLTSIVQRFGNGNAAPAQFGSDGRYARASAGFMGKVWDGGDVAFRPETWAAVYRVLKPGAHLVAFGGDRTFHRLACAIEDAGFEIRGTIAWIFGQGFPKNLDVSKRMRGCFSADALRACDHCCWQIVQDYPSGCSSDPDLDDAQLRSAKDNAQDGAPSQDDVRAHNHGDQRADDQEQEQASIFLDENTDHRSNGDYSHQSVRPSEDFQVGGSAQFDIPLSTSSDELRAAHRSRARKSNTARSDDDLVASTRYANLPQCPTCGKRGIPDGLGTSLKPAMELICLARKPLSEGTVAANVLRWGTGAINVDGCRVVTDENLNGGAYTGSQRHDGDENWRFKNGGARQPMLGDEREGAALGMFQPGKTAETSFKQPIGRWPANVVHDGSDEVVAAFPEANHKTGGPSSKSIGGNGIYQGGAPVVPVGYDDTGSAARFFYTAKADADDRLGSKHPTVKPLDLMQWLVRLVTPRGGVVLDPFAGTGTTGEAAWREGMSAVLIEAEPEYQADIRRRMALALAGPDERARESIKAKGLPYDPGPLFAGEAAWQAMWAKPFDFSQEPRE